MSNNTKTIAAALIGAGLLAGCTGTSGHAAPVANHVSASPDNGMGGPRPAAPAPIAPATLGSVQVPMSVDGYHVMECDIAGMEHMGEDTPQHGGVAYVEDVARNKQWDNPGAPCRNGMDHAMALYLYWKPASPEHPSDDYPHHQVGGGECWVRAKYATAGEGTLMECDRTVGGTTWRAEVSTDDVREQPVDYPAWHCPTEREAMDVIDAAVQLHG